MKTFSYVTFLLIFGLFFNCHNDNEDRLLPCKGYPVQINDKKWESSLPLDGKYPFDVRFFNENLYLFCSTKNGHDSLIVFNKTTRSYKLFESKWYYRDYLVSDPYVYFAINYPKPMILKLDISTGETQILVEEEEGKLIKSMQLEGDKLYFMVGYNNFLTLAKVKIFDLNSHQVTFYHENLNFFRSYIKDFVVWEDDSGLSHVTYMHNEPTLNMITFEVANGKIEYKKSIPFDKSYSKGWERGYHNDMYISYRDSISLEQVTKVIDLLTGQEKFTFGNEVKPVNAKYSRSPELLIDAVSGTVILEHKNSVLFKHENNIYMITGDYNRNIFLVALNLSSNCFEKNFSFNRYDDVYFDDRTNEMVIISTKNNTISAYQL